MAREELKKFRKGRELNQAAMAEKLGISLSHYKGIERGAQNPSLKTVYRFYEAFNGQYDDIWKLFGKF